MGFEACQFGSKVPMEPIGEIQGLDGGEPGALTGCITCRFSLCEIRCGGDRLRDPLLRVSAEKEINSSTIIIMENANSNNNNNIHTSTYFVHNLKKLRIYFKNDLGEMP